MMVADCVVFRWLFLCWLMIAGASASTFTFTNNCGYEVWPGLLSGAGVSPMSTTGFELQPGDSRAVDAPAAWSGRIWGRTLCGVDSAGRFACRTGDCGSGDVECGGGGAAPPATLAEFTLSGGGGRDFYDVSLVDGYNLPMAVAADGGDGGGGCKTTGCVVDLNGLCPGELRVGGVGERAVACRSACEAYGADEYCCSGTYGSPATCRPTAYSAFFKNACPRAYSYAYDDATSTFTCAAGANYAVTFCPSTTALKSSDQNAGTLPLVNETMLAVVGGARRRPRTVGFIQAVAAVAAWRWLWEL